MGIAARLPYVGTAALGCPVECSSTPRVSSASSVVKSAYCGFCIIPPISIFV